MAFFGGPVVSRIFDTLFEMIENPYSSLRFSFSFNSQSASDNLIEVKKNGKFSSTLILAPPNEYPQALSCFLKNVCKKMIIKTARPINRSGEL